MSTLERWTSVSPGLSVTKKQNKDVDKYRLGLWNFMGGHFESGTQWFVSLLLSSLCHLSRQVFQRYHFKRGGGEKKLRSYLWSNSVSCIDGCHTVWADDFANPTLNHNAVATIMGRPQSMIVLKAIIPVPLWGTYPYHLICHTYIPYTGTKKYYKMGE